MLCCAAGQLGDRPAHRRPPRLGAAAVQGEGLLHAAQRGRGARRRVTLAARALRRHAARVQPLAHGERARNVHPVLPEPRPQEGALVDRPLLLLSPPVPHHLRVQQYVLSALRCYRTYTCYTTHSYVFTVL